MADTRVRPVDPRLLRYASASRAFFVAIALLIGVIDLGVRRRAAQD